MFTNVKIFIWDTDVKGVDKSACARAAAPNGSQLSAQPHVSSHVRPHLCWLVLSYKTCRKRHSLVKVKESYGSRCFAVLSVKWNDPPSERDLRRASQ
jgi:hypothetical protein